MQAKNLKKKYDDIYSELEKQKSEYIKKLKQVSQSTDCETEFTNAYSLSPKDTFFELLLTISKHYYQNRTHTTFGIMTFLTKKVMSRNSSTKTKSFYRITLLNMMNFLKNQNSSKAQRILLVHIKQTNY